MNNFLIFIFFISFFTDFRCERFVGFIIFIKNHSKKGVFENAGVILRDSLILVCMSADEFPLQNLSTRLHAYASS